MQNPISAKVRGWIYLVSAIVAAASTAVTPILVATGQDTLIPVASSIFGAFALVTGILARANLDTVAPSDGRHAADVEPN